MEVAGKIGKYFSNITTKKLKKIAFHKIVSVKSHLSLIHLGNTTKFLEMKKTMNSSHVESCENEMHFKFKKIRWLTPATNEILRRLGSIDSGRLKVVLQVNTIHSKGVS